MNAFAVIEPAALETAPILHDVAAQERPEVAGALDRVGMTEIEIPVRVPGPEGQPLLTPARVDAFVSLDDPDAKGIHMSRLYLLLQETLGKEVLTGATLESLLHGFVESHAGISQSAHFEARFDYMVLRPALLSGCEGWRSYPVRIAGDLVRGRFRSETSVRVTYSSTCPCSAALARQHIQERFAEDFGERGMVSAQAVNRWLGTPQGVSATPHSQRSHADVDVAAKAGEGPDLMQLIDAVESAVQTPVQAAVKRMDEQEFARLNGENPMFCEDAARRIRRALEEQPGLSSWAVRIEHQESLHPHNAVSSVAGSSGPQNHAL